MAELGPAFEILMRLEGGGVLHTVKGDPGGTTKYGISQRAHPDVDIAGLTREDAIDIYNSEYWQPLGLSLLASQDVAGEIFEFAVNAGFKPSVRAAQLAANYVLSLFPHGATPRARLVVDGHMGPKTRNTLNILSSRRIAEALLVDRFNLNQLKHYRGLRPDLVDRFFLGWTRRVIA